MTGSGSQLGAIMFLKRRICHLLVAVERLLFSVSKYFIWYNMCYLKKRWRPVGKSFQSCRLCTNCVILNFHDFCAPEREKRWLLVSFNGHPIHWRICLFSPCSTSATAARKCLLPSRHGWPCFCAGDVMEVKVYKMAKYKE